MNVSCEEPSRIKSWIFQPMSSGHKKKDMDIVMWACLMKVESW